MRNPLVKVVERELNRLGIHNAKLVRESYDSQNFGNAEAIYKLGNVQLRFLRDRSDDTVDIGSIASPQNFYDSYDVAVWMGWIDFDELMKYYNAPIDFAEPPGGAVFTLSDILGFFTKDLKQLDKAFSSSELMSTHAQLKDTERRRVSAMSRPPSGDNSDNE